MKAYIFWYDVKHKSHTDHNLVLTAIMHYNSYIYTIIDLHRLMNPSIDYRFNTLPSVVEHSRSKSIKKSMRPYSSLN